MYTMVFRQTKAIQEKSCVRVIPFDTLMEYRNHIKVSHVFRTEYGAVLYKPNLYERAINERHNF